ncbi:MetQ/NlpA family ABC transporter substrate-binding protein [Ornithinimicrobium cryptoxanthini]|uniref:MetQ/NlpA family ABC transporter substrate-binding protein n=1 Tax=Ornithinimicrobium cryptoxanthini TaxID=2934161 RepID=A0ABY4YDY2_9MICO|nr:MetQ/NlpA family ABC transporter substrate-binding protein [Ornithinimicrobium cryptoxanthini]USQ74996.1 MetQ/NlpA family ABC transporter substrate-binding protein [Ornithinimicrobium cryptoxanthini]
MSEPIDTTTGAAPVLPEKPKRSRTPLIAGAAVLVAALAVGGWALTRGGEDADVIRIGTTEASQPHWQILKEKAAEEGIEVEIVNFSEYTLPNPALAEEEIDLNSFQHLLYLADHNLNTGDDLRPIGSTMIVPLPLYSEKYDSLEEFVKGDQVAIPNDATNQARALFVLEGAGLITFTGDPASPTPDDVDEEASTVVVRPVEASQTAGLIKDADVAAVIVNNNFATDAGFDLASYLYADDPESAGAQPYINIFAARPGDVQNETFRKIVEIYHNPEVLESVVDSSGGTALIVEGYDADRLQEVLEETETNLQAAN